MHNVWRSALRVENLKCRMFGASRKTSIVKCPLRGQCGNANAGFARNGGVSKCGGA